MGYNDLEQRLLQGAWTYSQPGFAVHLLANPAAQLGQGFHLFA